MATKKYEISFNRYGGRLNNIGETLHVDLYLTDEQLAGLLFGLHYAVDGAPHNGPRHLFIIRFDTYEYEVHTDTHLYPYDEYYVAHTLYGDYFVNKFRTMGYSQAVYESFWYKDNADNIRAVYIDITKRYSMVYKGPMMSYLLQFNTLGFLQGFLTACQWLNINCKPNMLIFERETLQTIE